MGIDRQSELESSATLRATVPALEAILYAPMTVLDHGFVRVIDYMGDDGAVVNAARVSYGRGTRAVSEDRALIQYLMRHHHSTPFEMAEIKLHIKLPIFVARQWIRHRTASVNEYSARYSILDREFYVPSATDLAGQSTDNRQGRGPVLSADEAAKVIDILKSDAERNYENYEWMLNENPKDDDRIGIARELARINLTLSTYTQWYWKIDLHNLLGFLQLRADTHAQMEIRAYANVLLEIVKKWVPESYDAFREYRLESIALSKSAVEVLRRIIAGENVSHANSGISLREWRELVHRFGIKSA